MADFLSPAMASRHSQAVASTHPYLRSYYYSMDSITPDNCFLYVYCGHRGKASQNAAFASGNSHAKWGQSWHNPTPSLAFDCVPLWEDNPHTVEWGSDRTKALLATLAKHVPDIEWGGGWTHPDRYHFQLFHDPKPPEWAVFDGYDLDLDLIPKFATEDT